MQAFGVLLFSRPQLLHFTRQLNAHATLSWHQHQPALGPNGRSYQPPLAMPSQHKNLLSNHAQDHLSHIARTNQPNIELDPQLLTTTCSRCVMIPHNSNLALTSRPNTYCIASRGQYPLSRIGIKSYKLWHSRPTHPLLDPGPQTKKVPEF